MKKQYRSNLGIIGIVAMSSALALGPCRDAMAEDVDIKPNMQDLYYVNNPHPMAWTWARNKYVVGEVIPNWKDHALKSFCENLAEREATDTQRHRLMDERAGLSCPDSCYRSAMADNTRVGVARMWGIDCDTGVFWGIMGRYYVRVNIELEKLACQHVCTEVREEL